MGITYIENLGVNQNGADDAQAYSVVEEMVESYKKTVYQTTIWQSLVFIVYFALIMTSLDEFQMLHDAFPQCYYFMIINMGLYLFGSMNS